MRSPTAAKFRAVLVPGDVCSTSYGGCSVVASLSLGHGIRGPLRAGTPADAGGWAAGGAALGARSGALGDRRALFASAAPSGAVAAKAGAGAPGRAAAGGIRSGVVVWAKEADFLSGTLASGRVGGPSPATKRVPQAAHASASRETKDSHFGQT
jgi:hypothetical protein